MNAALSKYLKDRGETQSEFARRGGWRAATVSAWMNGTIPEPENMIRVEGLTKGAVPMSSWFDVAPQKAAS